MRLISRSLAGVVLGVSLSSCAGPTHAVTVETDLGVSPHWKVSAGESGVSLKAAGITDSVVVVASQAELVGIARTSGRRLWSFPVPFVMPYGGVVVASEQQAAIVSEDGFIRFDPRSGALLSSWTSPTPSNSPAYSLPQLLADGRILFASRSRHLIALDMRSGALDTLLLLPGDLTHKSSISSIAVRQDTVYASVYTETARGSAFVTTVLYRFSLADAHLDSLEKYPSDSSGLARWMHATSSLLIAPTDYSDPSWLAFDRATGRLKWKVPAMPGSLGPSSQAAFVGDTMFAAGNDGKGYVVHMPSGRLLRSFRVPTALIAGVAACSSHLLVNSIGEIDVIARDGSSSGKVVGLQEGDVFNGMFAIGHGVAVIGSIEGTWAAFDCPAP